MAPTDCTCEEAQQHYAARARYSEHLSAQSRGRPQSLSAVTNKCFADGTRALRSLATRLCRRLNAHSKAWFRYLAAILAGLFFAVVTVEAFNLQTRHLVGFIVGIVLLSLALFLADRMRDLLLYLLAFNLPFTSIEKTFLITNDPTFMVSGIAIGLLDTILVSLYVAWFVRIFVKREERFPALTKLDWCVLAFIAVHAVSLLQSSSKVLTVYEIVRLGKYILAYFYIAHNLSRRHLKWVVAGVLSAIIVQSVLGVVQQRTGSLLGIGRTKGALDVQYEQYIVTGFEGARRAEGTTFDSHALGLFLAMTLPLPLALVLAPELRLRYRLMVAATLMAGLAGMTVSFSRAGWAAFAGGAFVLIGCFAYWKEWRRIIQVGIVSAALALPALLPFVSSIRQRLFEAPPELVTARIETIQMSLAIWRDSPITGCGANAYMRALQTHFSIFEGDPYFIPPHNLLVFVMTELGVIGLLAFLGLSVAVCAVNWKLVRQRASLLRLLGAALLAGFVAFQLEGISDPIYATSVTYFLLWFQIGLSAGLYRMSKEAQDTVAS